eukprot:symbB.v1.2.006580.t1/scaffold387.1/size215482/3
MTSIIDRIPDHDIIGYTAEYQSFHKGQFSSNFLAGKKGSKVMGAIWKAQKQRLQQHCPTFEPEPKSGACCYDDVTRPCSVRWAGLGEGISHPAVKALIQSNSSFKSYMFSGDESFVPDGLVEVLKKKMNKEDAMKYWKRRNVRQPLSRNLYHLFNSQGFADAYSCMDLTNDTTHSVAGELFKLSRVQRKVARHGGRARKCANDGSLCRCNGMVFYGRRFACKGGDETDLTLLTQSQHAVREASSTIRCGGEDFGGDPLYGAAKHCICAARPSCFFCIMLFFSAAFQELSFQDFLRVVMALRGSNAVTLKDIMDLRRTLHKHHRELRGAVHDLEERTVRSSGVPVPPSPLSRSHKIYPGNTIEVSASLGVSSLCEAPPSESLGSRIPLPCTIEEEQVPLPPRPAWQRKLKNILEHQEIIEERQMLVRQDLQELMQMLPEAYLSRGFSAGTAWSDSMM